MIDNILCNIQHFPLLITKIFEYSLKRPFILHHMIQKSNYLKEKLKTIKVEKFNELPKEINKLFNFFDEISHFQENYKNLMTKEIKIEEEEKNFYITKPYINSLFDISDKLFFFYKSFLFNDKEKNLFAKNLFEFCLCQPYITLSINLFSKNNDINTINMELTEADLDYNYIKFLNKTQNLNQIQNQKIKMSVNIYNKYSRTKRKEFSKIVYYNNINLLKNLNIEEINFIRPSIKEAEKIEKFLYKNEIIDEINTMFIFIKELKYKNELIKVNFSDSIIRSISSLYKEVGLIKSFNGNNEFKNLKNIGISHNLINKNIQSTFSSLFISNFSIIYYQDIINFINDNKSFNILVQDVLYLNLENNIIYDINLYKYLANIFNKNNGQLLEKITRIEIIYNCEDINLFIKNIQIFENNLQKEKINNCYLNKNTKNKYYNFLSFICSFSKCFSSIIIQDSYFPFNIFDFDNININNITQLNIKSPSLNNYTYSEIIEIINNFKNLEFISIDNLSPKFNDSFKDSRISKNLGNMKEFKFNDFFEYKIIKGYKIIFRQNCTISEDLFFIFSEIVEKEKNLEKIELNGFPYNLEKITNQSVRNIEINLEEDDRNYIIKKIKYKNIYLKLQNFPNLDSLYIYVDILESVENFIQLPINPNLKRIFLFSSYINCDVNILDNFLKKNGVELILRIIESYNKGMIMAYIASFPSIN